MYITIETYHDTKFDNLMEIKDRDGKKKRGHGKIKEKAKIKLATKFSESQEPQHN